MTMMMAMTIMNITTRVPGCMWTPAMLDLPWSAQSFVTLWMGSDKSKKRKERNENSICREQIFIIDLEAAGKWWFNLFLLSNPCSLINFRLSTRRASTWTRTSGCWWTSTAARCGWSSKVKTWYHKKNYHNERPTGPTIQGSRSVSSDASSCGGSSLPSTLLLGVCHRLQGGIDIAKESHNVA